VTITAQSNNNSNPHLTLVPLSNGTPAASAGNLFYFTPYNSSDSSGASFTVNEQGTYLLLYTLVGLLNDTFGNPQNCCNANPAISCWICIQINRATDNTYPKQIGAVPLSVIPAQHTMQTAPTTSYSWILTGFGQIAAGLEPGDVVTLQITFTAPLRQFMPWLLISPRNKPCPQPPGDATVNGATLTIIKVG
jgi:hypothetical protein